ncbi:hypothetical protein ACNJQJ_22065, partial [Mycobacterium tuberculosis]
SAAPVWRHDPAPTVLNAHARHELIAEAFGGLIGLPAGEEHDHDDHDFCCSTTCYPCDERAGVDAVGTMDEVFARALRALGK